MSDQQTPLDLADGYYSAAELNIVRQARQLREELRLTRVALNQERDRGLVEFSHYRNQIEALKAERDTAQHEASGLRRELERLERRIWPNGERG